MSYLIKFINQLEHTLHELFGALLNGRLPENNKINQVQVCGLLTVYENLDRIFACLSMMSDRDALFERCDQLIQDLGRRQASIMKK